MARYLIVGHVTRDILTKGFRYGGAVLYGGLTARRLGFDTYVVTASAEKDLEEIFSELKFFHFLSPQTTVFENIETSRGRKQRVLAVADPIPIRDLPSTWRRADLVHIAPVLNEISPPEAALFETDFLVANPQGWFRRIDSEGKVILYRPDLSHAPRFKALVVSEEDIGARQEIVEDLNKISEILVITKGAEGALLYEKGKATFFEASPIKAKDTVGAGDILAAAFFGALYAQKSPSEALRFAMCLARLSVTREGLASVPTREEISSCF